MLRPKRIRSLASPIAASLIVTTYSGYDLGFVRGPAHHYLHHRFKNGNYGGHPFAMWDKLWGTELNKNGDRVFEVRRTLPRLERQRQRRFPCLPRVDMLLGAATVVIGSSAVVIHGGWAWLLVLFVGIWLALLSDILVVGAPGPRKKRKVFVIGLSRTGTTSITSGE